MKEVNVQDKQVYLSFKYPFLQIPALTDKRKCMRCGKEFVISDFKVYRNEAGEEQICCPYAPVCAGTVLDWEEL